MSGNGPDLAQIVALLSDVLRSQADFRQEMREQLRNVEARLDKVEARLNDLEWGLKDMRQTLTAYHASVMGHGILISELEARVQRIETHLGFAA